MSALNELKKHIKPCHVYRRSDLVKFSNAVDRHLHMLVSDGVLQKLAGGLYYCPKKTVFGTVPPEDDVLVRAFLKDNRFYLTSLNAYNSLGVGTSQLYNEKLVYNHKRDGRYELNGRSFYFIKRPCFPKKSSLEFLFVDLMNNLQFLAEDREMLQKNVTKKILKMDKKKILKAVSDYAGMRTKKFFKGVFEDTKLSYES